MQNCNVAYCCVWSVTLGEERRLRVIFAPKKDEVVGEWGRKHNKVLYVTKVKGQLLALVFLVFDSIRHNSREHTSTGRHGHNLIPNACSHITFISVHVNST